jgi:hypothetical protein
MRADCSGTESKQFQTLEQAVSQAAADAAEDIDADIKCLERLLLLTLVQRNFKKLHRIWKCPYEAMAGLQIIGVYNATTKQRLLGPKYFEDFFNTSGYRWTDPSCTPSSPVPPSLSIPLLCKYLPPNMLARREMQVPIVGCAWLAMTQVCTMVFSSPTGVHITGSHCVASYSLTTENCTR